MRLARWSLRRNLIVWLFAPLLLLSIGLCFCCEADASPVRVGIFIGVNEGHYFDEPLFYAENDAEKMMKVMLEVGGLNKAIAVLLQGVTARPSSSAIATDR